MRASFLLLIGAVYDMYFPRSSRPPDLVILTASEYSYFIPSAIAHSGSFAHGIKSRQNAESEVRVRGLELRLVLEGFIFSYGISLSKCQSPKVGSYGYCNYTFLLLPPRAKRRVAWAGKKNRAVL